MANNQLLASDNFASGSLAAGWSALFGDSVCQVVNHQTEPNALSTTAGQTWTGGNVFGNDQISEVTIGTAWANENGTFLSLKVRQQAAAATCYDVDLTNNSAAFFVITNGTSVQQGSTISGLTIAAGDVWVLQAAGSNISLYQNNKFIGYFADASITGGTPGYSQFSTINIGHTTVASWRGYNGVQQDGIWSKQGIIIAPNASDLTSFGAQNPTILLDSNPKLLTGSQVLKMWFWADSNQLGYAESAANDGINWTRRGSNVLTGNIADPVIMKVGTTYHLYGIDLGVSPTEVFHYTSTDGISWSAGTQVLAGTASAWDAYLIFFTPFFIDGNGTWHAVYSGSVDNTGTHSINLGHATSPDGVTWTKDAANPIASNFSGVESLVRVGSIWYAWGQTVNPGRGGANAGVDPGEGIRYQTTDFVHWTNPVKSLHNAQLFEGVNAVTGGCYPTGNILNINGKAYLYSDTSINDVTGSHNQITVAIAPSSIASIVQFNEDAIQQTSTDTFTSGSGNLDLNWTAPFFVGLLQVVSGPAVEAGTASEDCVGLFTGSSFSPNQYSEITIGTVATGAFACPVVRGQSNGDNHYFALITGPTNSLQSVSINKKISGAGTQIGPSTNITTQVGDVFRLVASGTAPVLLSLYQNHFLVLQVEDWADTYVAGSPGMLIFTPTLANTQITAWAGGNANVIPNFPGMIDGMLDVLKQPLETLTQL